MFLYLLLSIFINLYSDYVIIDHMYITTSNASAFAPEQARTPTGLLDQ